MRLNWIDFEYQSGIHEPRLKMVDQNAKGATVYALPRGLFITRLVLRGLAALISLVIISLGAVLCAKPETIHDSGLRAEVLVSLGPVVSQCPSVHSYSAALTFSQAIVVFIWSTLDAVVVMLRGETGQAYRIVRAVLDSLIPLGWLAALGILLAANGPESESHLERDDPRDVRMFWAAIGFGWIGL